MSKKVPSIPGVDHDIDVNVSRVLIPIKTIIEVREGDNPNSDPRDRNVTYQGLIDLGLITKDDLPN